MKISESWVKYEPQGETRTDPWDDYKHPDEQFRRWEGSRRVEVLVPVSKIVSAFKKLFKKETS